MTLRLPCGRNENTHKTLKTELYATISSVRGEEWDRIINSRHIFLGRAYLGALESSRIPMCHVVFRQEQQAVGAASFQVAAFTGAPLGSYLDYECALLALIARPMKIIKQPFVSTVVVCGSPFVSGEHGYLFQPGVTSEAAGAALSIASKKAKAELDKRIPTPTSGILFKEFHSSSESLVYTLGKNHFTDFQTDPSMVLPIDANWYGFEDYLDSLSSKYRVKANRAYEKSKYLLERDLRLDDVITYKERLGRLYAFVANRAPFRLGGVDTDTLFELRSGMGEDFRLKGYFLEQQLVGFRMGFINGDTLEAGLVGFDYGLNQQHAIYLRMLYDYLKFGIARRLKCVNYGRTASEIKSTLGAVPVPLSCCLSLERKTLNTMLPMFSGAIRPPKFALRKPFKKNWYELNEATLMRSVSAAPAAPATSAAHSQTGAS